MNISIQPKSRLRKRIYNWNIMLVKHAKKNTQSKNVPIKTLWSQAIKAGTRVGAMYFDAISSPNDNEIQKSLSHSLKLCNESKYWLKLIRDTGLDSSKQLETLLYESHIIARMLDRRVASLVRK